MSQEATQSTAEQRESLTRYCEYCGHALDPAAVFCPKCGTRLEGAEECQDYVYEAFISYRHRDLDSKVARRIQKRLEGFRIPKQLRGDEGKARLGRLFRDEDELPTSSSLGDQIRDALLHSRYLIVMCSPQTNESRWVAREIELFASFHGRDKIRLALVEGEPDESFPTLLRSRVTYDRNDQEVLVEEEPLAADFRDLSRRHFESEVLRLAAPLVGCGYDDLRQRLRARRMRIVTASLSAVTALSSAFTTFSVYQQRQIERNYAQAQRNESEYLAVQANDLAARGMKFEAIQVAQAALPKGSADKSRPYVPAAQLALENACQVFPPEGLWYTLCDVRGIDPTNFAVSASGLVAVRMADGSLRVIDPLERNGRPIAWSLDLSDLMKLGLLKRAWSSLTFLDDRLLVLDKGTLVCFDAKTGEVRWRQKGISVYDGVLAISHDGTCVAVAGNYPTELAIRVFDAQTGSLKQSFEIDSSLPDQMTFTADDARLVVAADDQLFSVDIATGDIAAATTGRAYVDSLYAEASGVYAVTIDEDPIMLVGNGAAGSDAKAFPDVSSIEAFSDELEPRWSHGIDNSARLSFATSSAKTGGDYLRTVRVCDVVHVADYEDREDLNLPGGDRVVCIANNRLLFLEVETGTELSTLEAPAPILSFHLPEGQPMYHFVDANGDAALRAFVSNSSWDKRYDTNLSAKTGARFISVGGTDMLVTTSTNPDCLQVYCTSSSSVYSGATPIEGLKKLTYVVDTPKYILALRGDDVVQFEKETFTEVHSYRHELYADETGRLTYFRGVSFGADDALYAFGPWKSDPGKQASQSLVLRQPLVESASEVGGDAGSTCKVDFVLDYLRCFTAGPCAGKPLVVGMGGNSLCLLNLETGEVLSEVHLDKNLIDVTPLDENHALVVEYDLAGYEYVYMTKLVSLVDGSEQECDLAGCIIDDPNNIALSSDGSSLIIVGADGAITSFDAKTGARKWSISGPSSKPNYLTTDPAVNAVFVQDETGICQLYSLVDGTMLASSSTALPPIYSSLSMGDGTLQVRWSWDKRPNDFRVSWYGGRTCDGMAIVSLDVDAFGPQSNVPTAQYFSSDLLSVVVNDLWENKHYCIYRYTLDEYLDYANELVQSWEAEFNDADRHAYQIGSWGKARRGAPHGKAN